MVRVWLGIKQRQLFMPKEILIVDDEPDVVVPIHFLMEQQGYKVKEVFEDTYENVRR